MATPTKEYRATIRVKLTDELLPSPVLSKEELQTLLDEALRVGAEESPVSSLGTRTTGWLRYLHDTSSEVMRRR